MSHYLCIISMSHFLIFMNFYKKIEEYIEDDDTNFTIWSNKPGLQGFADIIAKHARKCDGAITPCFNGFKVHIHYK